MSEVENINVRKCEMWYQCTKNVTTQSVIWYKKTNKKMISLSFSWGINGKPIFFC
jgi:hypothetical protein